MGRSDWGAKDPVAANAAPSARDKPNPERPGAHLFWGPHAGTRDLSVSDYRGVDGVAHPGAGATEMASWLANSLDSGNGGDSGMN